MRFYDANGFYELNPFPGCNQIVVSNHAFVHEHLRGQGLGSQQHGERIQQAKMMGYDLMLCTVREGNHKEIHILNSMGWKWLTMFTSTETGHTLRLYCKHLEQPGSVNAALVQREVENAEKYDEQRGEFTATDCPSMCV